MEHWEEVVQYTTSHCRRVVALIGGGAYNFRIANSIPYDAAAAQAVEIAARYGVWAITGENQWSDFEMKGGTGALHILDNKANRQKLTAFYT